MQRMRRKQIYIEAELAKQLRRMSRHRRLTESELVRQGLKHVLNSPAPSELDPGAWEEELACIDSLIKKGPITGGRNWKREDIYERR